MVQSGGLLRALLALVVAASVPFLAYVLVANVMLSTGLIEHMVNRDPETAQLTFDSAWSILPGRVHVSGYRVRVQDSVLQFHIDVAHAVVDVSLLELADRRLHLTRVRADGVVFRLRLRRSGTEAGLLPRDVVPPIPGLSDPPLAPIGPPEPPPTDEAYDLWSAHLGDVEADLRELWIEGVRFEGAAFVRGGFSFQPLRRFQLSPTRVDVSEGRLTVGKHAVARGIEGELSATFEPWDIRTTTPRDALRRLTGYARLQAQIPSFDVSRADLRGVSELAVHDGSGALALHGGVARGVVSEGSRLCYETSRLFVQQGEASIAGSAHLVVVAEPERMTTTLRVPLARIQRRGARGQSPEIEDALATFTMGTLDLVEPYPPTRVSLDVPARVPDLRWVSDVVRGRAFLRAGLTVDEAGRVSGRARARFFDVEARLDGIGMDGAGAAELDVEGDAERGLRTKGSVTLDDVTLRRGDDIERSWWGRVDVTGGSLRPVERELDMQLRLQCKDAAPALLFLERAELVPGIARGLLRMPGLSAGASLGLRRDRVSLRRLDARGGSTQVKGDLRAGAGGVAGALLVRVGLLSAGVAFQKESTDVSPLVGDDWLRAQVAAVRW